MTESPTPVSGDAMELVERLQDDGACASTPSEELERQIMDSRVPKNEREWWAKREIERLRSQGGAPEGTPPKPVRERLDWTEYKFGECEECDERRNLGRDQNGALICGSCSDERYTAELEGYANALRATLSTDTKDGGGAHG